MPDQELYNFPEGPIQCALTKDQVNAYYSLQVSCPAQCAPGSLWAKQKAQYIKVYTTPLAGAGFQIVKRATLNGRIRSSTRFRFVSTTNNGARSGKRGYFKLEEGGCTLGNPFMPSQEVYLHRLLCFMYRAPPPPHQDVEACHMCENRLCLAPWHLMWAPHGTNIKGGIAHKRNRHRYHPYEATQ